MILHFTPVGVSLKHVSPFYLAICTGDGRINRSICARRIAEHFIVFRRETRKIKCGFDEVPPYGVTTNLNHFMGRGKVQVKIGPERWRTIYRVRVVSKIDTKF